MLAAALLLLLTGPRRTAAGVYVHQYSYVHDDFFSAWTFESGEDPTHGTVEYVGQAEAEAAGLIRATADHVYMGVDMETVLPASGGRRSVRVQSRTAYSEGLFILEVEHVPTGCGLWPAFWMFGADPAHPWPTWGEYDIIEGVHRATRVMSSLHTSQHCSQESVGYGAGPTVEWGTGRHGRPTTDCYVAAPDQWPNQGCTQTGPESTMGAAFNAAGGGTYAAEWDPQAGHIRTWFWPRGTEPPDLVLRQPDPQNWGPAYSFFRIDPGNCDPAHFQQMRLVFDITFCGDMGAPTFADSCPDQAVQGLNCQDFVRMHPEEMTEAYWSISALDIYIQETGVPLQPKPFAPPEQPPVVPPLGSAPQEGNATWNWLVALGCIGALGVAMLYALVWLKVQKDTGEANRFTALYDQYNNLLFGSAGGLSSLPWIRRFLIPANLHSNSWSRVALDDKDNKSEDDHPRYPSQGSLHRAGSMGGAPSSPMRGGTPPPHGSHNLGAAGSSSGLGNAPPVLSVQSVRGQHGNRAAQGMPSPQGQHGNRGRSVSPKREARGLASTARAA